MRCLHTAHCWQRYIVYSLEQEQLVSHKSSMKQSRYFKIGNTLAAIWGACGVTASAEELPPLSFNLQYGIIFANDATASDRVECKTEKDCVIYHDEKAGIELSIRVDRVHGTNSTITSANISCGIPDCSFQNHRNSIGISGLPYILFYRGLSPNGLELPYRQYLGRLLIRHPKFGTSSKTTDHRI